MGEMSRSEFIDRFNRCAKKAEGYTFVTTTNEGPMADIYVAGDGSIYIEGKVTPYPLQRKPGVRRGVLEARRGRGAAQQTRGKSQLRNGRSNLVQRYDRPRVPLKALDEGNQGL